MPPRKLLIRNPSNLFIGLLFFTWIPSRLDSATPPQYARALAMEVVATLERLHVQGGNFNDEISERGFTLFLESLDPNRCYFLQSDVEALERQRLTLDDLLRQGNVDFAFDAYAKWMLRASRLFPLTHHVIDLSHDFAAEEFWIADPQKLPFCVDEAELDERWRMRIKHEMLTLRADGKDDFEIRQRLHSKYQELEESQSQIQADALVALYLRSMTLAFDPHTRYMTASELKIFNDRLQLQATGIGAVLHESNDRPIVEALVPGGAAEKDGRIRPGDTILAVRSSSETEWRDTLGKSTEEVAQWIRGQPDTLVALQIQPGSGSLPVVYEFLRIAFQPGSSRARSEIVEHRITPSDSPTRIGIVELDSFYLATAVDKNSEVRSAHRDLEKILKEFSSASIDVVMLDLSQNNQGFLSEAVAAAGLFLGDGPVVQIKGPTSPLEVLNAPVARAVWTGPLVVQVSQQSTSASEVFAAAIQDYRRGLIIGDRRTHGKGTVQSVIALSKADHRPGHTEDLGGLKLTTKQFYLPSGRSTQRAGVQSEVVILSWSEWSRDTEEDLPYSIGPTPAAPIAFGEFESLTGQQVSKLQVLSNRRTHELEPFQAARKYSEDRKRSAAGEQIPLRQEDFDLYWKSTSELAKQLQNDYFRSRAYRNEVLNIACDYRASWVSLSARP